MTNLTRFRDLVIACALVAVPAVAHAQAPSSSTPAAPAGEEPSEQAPAPSEQAPEPAEQGQEPSEHAQKMESPEASAHRHARDIRAQTMSAELALISIEPAMISSFAQVEPLTPAGQAQVTDKLDVFEAKLDRLAPMIDQLQALDAADWDARDAKVTAAIAQVRTARDAAWRALQNAPRTRAAS